MPGHVVGSGCVSAGQAGVRSPARVFGLPSFSGNDEAQGMLPGAFASAGGRHSPLLNSQMHRCRFLTEAEKTALSLGVQSNQSPGPSEDGIHRPPCRAPDLTDEASPITFCSHPHSSCPDVPSLSLTRSAGREPLVHGFSLNPGLKRPASTPPGSLPTPRGASSQRGLVMGRDVMQHRGLTALCSCADILPGVSPYGTVQTQRSLA